METTRSACFSHGILPVSDKFSLRESHSIECSFFKSRYATFHIGAFINLSSVEMQEAWPSDPLDRCSRFSYCAFLCNLHAKTGPNVHCMAKVREWLNLWESLIFTRSLNYAVRYPICQPATISSTRMERHTWDRPHTFSAFWLGFLRSMYTRGSKFILYLYNWLSLMLQHHLINANCVYFELFLKHRSTD